VHGRGFFPDFGEWGFRGYFEDRYLRGGYFIEIGVFRPF
jgi:hypothetical protein